MSAFWTYVWPAFGVGLLSGAIAGIFAYRVKPSSRAWVRPVSIGIVVSLAATVLWHYPLGGADRFQARENRAVHALLVRYEMTQVQAHLQTGPLTRRVLLSGPADDFQRSELVRYMDQLPSVESASWDPSGRGIPLIIEALRVSLAGFCLGLLLAYLVALHRRYNAQWSW